MSFQIIFLYWAKFLDMRKKIELEYIFSSSVKVLFARLSTPAGLSEWFADDVLQRDGKFVFIWNGVEHAAVLLEQRNNVFVRFRWEDSPDPEEYFEFNIHVQPLTEDVALLVTDFTTEEDETDTIDLWDKQIEMLHRTLGA